MSLRSFRVASIALAFAVVVSSCSANDESSSTSGPVPDTPPDTTMVVDDTNPSVTFDDPPPDQPSTTDSTPVSVPEPPTASDGCIGVDLFSQPMASASTGVRLRMEPDGQLIWDFGSGEPYSVDDGFGNLSTIELAGTITATYTGSDDSYTTTVSEIDLSGTVEVLGNVIALPPEAFTGAAADPSLGVTSETLTCSNGSITMERTGQVYS